MRSGVKTSRGDVTFIKQKPAPGNRQHTHSCVRHTFFLTNLMSCPSQLSLVHHVEKQLYCLFAKFRTKCSLLRFFSFNSLHNSAVHTFG